MFDMRDLRDAICYFGSLAFGVCDLQGREAVYFSRWAAVD